MSSPCCEGRFFCNSMQCDVICTFISCTFFSHLHVLKTTGFFCNATQTGMSEQLARLAVRSCERLSSVTRFNGWCCECVPFTHCNSFLTVWQMGKLTKLITAYCYSEMTRHRATTTCMSGVAGLCWYTAGRQHFHCYNAQNNKSGPSRRKSTETVFTMPKETRD